MNFLTSNKNSGIKFYIEKNNQQMSLFPMQSCIELSLGDIVCKSNLKRGNRTKHYKYDHLYK